MMKKAMMALALCASALSASATPVAIQNGFIRAGVSDYGTLGSNGNVSPGILFDQTGTSNFGRNDFLTPGTPFEGFYLTGSRGSYYSNNTGSTNFLTSSPLVTSGTSATWTSVSRDGSLRVTNSYSLSSYGSQQVIAIHSDFTNLGSAMTDVRALRTLDPDPDVNAYGSYFTNNTVLSNDQACSTGPRTGETICIYSASPFTHRAGVSSAWSGWTTNPLDFLNGINGGNGDYTIGMGFDIGNVAAGATFGLDYLYVLGASLGDVKDVGKVPEPASLFLIGLGLLGLGAARRRKNIA